MEIVSEMIFSHLVTPSPTTRGNLSGQCSVCGYKGNDLFLNSDILSKSTGSAAELCRIPSGLMCPHCWALWSKPKVYARSMWVTETSVKFPTIAPDPKGVRPMWRDVVRDFDPQTSRGVVLTTDPKKRIWPFASVSSGHFVSLYLHDPSRGISELRQLSGAKWWQQIQQIEEWLTYFSKAAIACCLLGNLQQCRKLGVSWAAEQEKISSKLRATPEFIPALIVAQKQK